MTLFCQSHWRDTHIAKVVTVFTQWGLDPIKNWKVRKGKQEKQSTKQETQKSIHISSWNDPEKC